MSERVLESAHLLIAEDDGLLRTIYGEALAAAGHRVQLAEDGLAALEALDEGVFDLLVTDLLMPRMGGLELLDRAKGRDPDLGVIVLTSLNSAAPAVRALRAGAFHYLVKPLDPEALVLEVERCLEHRRVVRENRELRRHHHLLLAAQRLLSCRSLEDLGQVVVEVARSTLDADAVVFARGDTEALAVARAEAMSDEAAQTLLALCLEAVQQAPGPFEVPSASGGYGSALFFDARSRSEGPPPARVLALRRTGRPAFPAEAAYDAAILGESLGLALENVQQLDSARVVADLDSLTGLWNARALEHTLDREIAARTPGGAPFSVLFMDLDHFKRVNDVHGHLVGSAVLVEMARLLKRCLRVEDVLVRYGGDELVAVLLDADTAHAVAVAERIRATVEAHRFMSREGLELQLTLCCGVATWPIHAPTRLEVMNRADLAMYRGKKEHRNAVWVWDQLPAAR
jgi:diguanylate cyclase (GGDEF)-like protein